MAEPLVPVKYLDDITECPICTNIFTDPRELPCVHTFCLKCIEGWAANRKPDEHKLACPLCRHEITVTQDDLKKLPKNLFVEKLLEVKKMSSGLSSTEASCDWCKTSRPSAVGTAAVHCIECQQKMCTQCCELHKNVKALALHRLVELDKEDNSEDMLVKFSSQMCEKHRDKHLEVYCQQCKVVVCLMCCVTEHKAHDCSDVNKVAKEMSGRIKTDCDSAIQTSTKYRENIGELAEAEESLLNRAREIEQEIENREAKMKDAIEKRKRELQEELMSVKQHDLKQIEGARDELQRRLLMIDSFKKYSEQLIEKGSAVDIARDASCLRGRAEELVKLGTNEALVIPTRLVNVAFIADESNAHLVDETFGKLHPMNVIDKTPEVNFMSSSKPLYMVPSTGNAVAGVTTLADEVFVSRKGAKHIDVYNASDLSLRRKLQLSSLATGGNRGLVACSLNKCIYLSDCTAHLVHKVSVDGTTPATHWSVSGKVPMQLSLTANSNILVIYWEATSNKIHEYTKAGVLVREIVLPAGSGNGVHAIELPDGCYGIIHEGTSGHRYCVINAVSQVIRSFGGTNGSGEGQLDSPRCLARDKRGFVYITDRDNNRVLVLDPKTFCAKQLPIEGGLNKPWYVHIDETRGRLYIGEWNGGRIIVLGLS